MLRNPTCVIKVTNAAHCSMYHKSVLSGEDVPDHERSAPVVPWKAVPSASSQLLRICLACTLPRLCQQNSLELEVRLRI